MQTAHWQRVRGVTITLLGAEEGETQGDVVVALGVRALHVPAHTFIHAAIVPNQEAVEQGDLGSGAGIVAHACERRNHLPPLQRDNGSSHGHYRESVWTRPRQWLS